MKERVAVMNSQLTIFLEFSCNGVADATRRAAFDRNIS